MIDRNKPADTPINEKPKQPAPDKPAKKEEFMETIKDEMKKEKKKGFFIFLGMQMNHGEFAPLRDGLGGIVDQYRSFKEIKEETRQKYDTYETVVQGAHDSIEFFILLILSCLIATMGLFANSTAVIIGAMLVAPLMGPVLGFSAGLLWGSRKVILKSTFTLFKGIVIVLAITAALAYFIPGISVTPEMQSRSLPSIFDIIIALASGAVGAYAYANKKITNAISGVAISVALMPPLCTIGIGIGFGNWALSWGAFILFAVNIVGISLAALIVFQLIRLHPHAEDEEEFQKARKRAAGQIIISTLLLIVLSVPLVYFMSLSFQREGEKSKTEATIDQFMTSGRIYDLKLKFSKLTNTIDLVVLLKKDDKLFNPTNMTDELEKQLNKKVILLLYTIHLTEETITN
ncbi:MAG: TIGR00341 family protein [Brevinematales bacterium]|nr:TIGR00341 family protein [Brevinematales bacterium]